MILVEMKPSKVFFNTLKLRLGHSLKYYQTIDKATYHTPPYLGA
jgi:hypothetical protein